MSDTIDLYDLYEIGYDYIECLKKFNKMFIKNKEKFNDDDIRICNEVSDEMQKLKQSYSELVKHFEINKINRNKV
jgi:hypothetical protein